MPGSVAPVSPSGVFPRILASSLSMELRLEPLINSYPDGSSDRAVLAANMRHYFKVTLPLTPAARNTLYTFYQAHKGSPFYVYNPRETVPPFNYDPTGADPIGRYTVVFDSPWSETTANPRIQVGLALREVA